jgi:hypothetical protein
MYLVFKGDYYYPQGGWQDFVGSFDTYDEADEAAATRSSEWSHIVHDGAIILQRDEHNREVWLD